jgi:N-acetylneuraminate synthase/N,N'-diacetyllegionaminate synthase
MNAIQIGPFTIGPGAPCFIAAEIGINHNGDMQLAHRMIDAAADAGADAVKFQNYRTEDFLSDRSLTYEYLSQGETVVESQWDMFKRCELEPESLGELSRHCDDRRVVFFSTPTSQQGIDDLLHLGAPLLKNGSDYLVHLPLVKAMGRSGIPTILSTGMATLAEIDDAVRAFREAGGKELILLHCTSSYPTLAEDVHLRKIPALASAFGCPVGLSDHTDGVVAAIGAVALGACMIEKHFTLDRNLPGPDHRFSSDPSEFAALVRDVRNLEASLGVSVIGPTPSEMGGRHDFRLSCVAGYDLPADHLLKASDIVFRRPGTGLPPRALDSLVGRRLQHGIAAGTMILPTQLYEEQTA